MGQRHGRASTFASTFVFPGGVVDADDSLVEQFCLGLEATTADERLSLEEGGLAFFSTAIRELFEETGVLLARDETGEWVGELASTLAEQREPLADGSVA